MSNPVAFNHHDPCIARSEALLARAREVIPAATQTLAKGPTQWVDGVAPKLLRRGRGARVTDVDDNEYLDFVMALGPVSLGYAYPAVDDAIREQLEQGISFSLVHPLEVEVAELVRDVVPCAEMVRFGKTGADVTSAAVRLARAFTRRTKVLCCGYHGWHDWYVGTTTRALGVPHQSRRLVSSFAYGDLDDLRAKLDSDTACVILEPVAFQMPPSGYLEGVRQLCSERGAVLVFDEMWTGFRAALGGAQQRFGVTPDLATFSKAIANGMPLSVLAGRRDVMELATEDIFFFTTFGGETLSLAAAKATVSELERHAVPEHMEALGCLLRRELEPILSSQGLEALKCIGLPCRLGLVWTDSKRADPLVVKSFVQQELIRRGILWGGFHALSLSHTMEDIEYLVSAYREVLPMLARNLEAGTTRAALRGHPVQAAFKPAAPISRPTGTAVPYPSARPNPG